MAGPTTAKSAIKWAWRFTCTERIEVADAMAEVIAKLVRKRKKRLLVSFDWTEFRDFHTLMAAACIKGRSVPDPDQLLRCVRHATEDAASKWG